MIRLLHVLVLIVVAVLAALFAYQNQGTVTIRYYGGLDWEVTLPLLMVGVFCAGLAWAWVAGWLTRLSLHRQIKQLRQQLAKAS